MKKSFGLFAASLLMAVPAIAQAGSVTSKFDVTLGGYVKLDYAYNSVNLGQNGGLTPGTGAIPRVNSSTGNQDQSILTSRQSRLWLKVAGPEFYGAKTNALIEGDFYGDDSAAAESPQFRMRQAWGSLDWANTQVLFGQAYDIFGPMIASTIDFRSGAPFGTPNNPRVPQIRLTQTTHLNADNTLRFVLGVQDPNQLGNNNSAASGTFGSMVNVAGQVMYESKALGAAPGYYGLGMKPLTVGAFGLVGSQKVTGNHAVDVYGYGLYTFVPVLKSADGKSRAMTMSFEGQGYISAGMTWNDANSTPATVGALPDETGAKEFGLASQLIFYPTQDLGITAGYGRRNAIDVGTYSTVVAENAQRYAEEYYANVAYDLNSAVRVATEFQHLKTQYVVAAGAAGGDFGQANIIRLAAYYFF